MRKSNVFNNDNSHISSMKVSFCLFLIIPHFHFPLFLPAILSPLHPIWKWIPENVKWNNPLHFQASFTRFFSQVFYFRRLKSRLGWNLGDDLKVVFVESSQNFHKNRRENLTKLRFFCHKNMFKTNLSSHTPAVRVCPLDDFLCLGGTQQNQPAMVAGASWHEDATNLVNMHTFLCGGVHTPNNVFLRQATRTTL